MYPMRASWFSLWTRQHQGLLSWWGSRWCFILNLSWCRGPRLFRCFLDHDDMMADVWLAFSTAGSSQSIACAKSLWRKYLVAAQLGRPWHVFDDTSKFLFLMPNIRPAFGCKIIVVLCPWETGCDAGWQFQSFYIPEKKSAFVLESGKEMFPT